MAVLGIVSAPVRKLTTRFCCVLLASSALTAYSQEAQISGIWVGHLGDAENPMEFYYNFVPSSNGLVMPFFSAPCYGTRYMNVPFPKFTNAATISFPTFNGTYDPASSTIKGSIQFSPDPIPITLERTNAVKPPDVEESTASTVSPAWVFSTGAPVWSSPTLAGNTVYIGNDNGELFAIDPDSGTQKWKLKCDGMIRSQPAYSKGKLYFTSDDGFVHAVSHEGTLLWKFDLHCKDYKRDAPAATSRGWDYTLSSPVLSGKDLYVGSADGCLYAINPDNGVERWHFKTDAPIRATPNANGSMVFAANWSGKLCGIDRATGKSAWEFNSKMPIVSQPTVSDIGIIFGCRNAYLWCIDCKSGKEVWNRNYWGSWVESSATVSGNVAYVGSSDLRKVLAVDVRTGKKIWQTKASGYPWGKPVIDGQNIYIGTIEAGGKAGYFYVLNKSTGAIRCKIEPKVDQKQFLNGAYGAPVFTKKLVVFGSVNGDVYGYRKAF